MNNPLLRASVVVFGTWWGVLSFIALQDASHFSAENLSVALHKASFVGAAVLIGLAYPIAYLFRRRRLRLELLSGTTRRGLQITLGPIPKGLLPPDRIPGSVFTPDEGDPLAQWLEYIQEHRPDIHAVFNALTDIYAANLALPAAPVPFGHGGRSLFDHTMVVVEMIIAKSQSFNFDGSYSKSGKKISGLNDPHYTFDRGDPLIPLIGYAHDIGKIEAYKLLPDGRVKEVLPDHDRPGRLLLARLDEVWGLPKDDRDALMNAVGYYHHPHALPRHVEDRSRALMELLLEADLAAGEWEGKNPLSTTPRAAPVPRVSTTRTEPVVPTTPQAWLSPEKEPAIPASAPATSLPVEAPGTAEAGSAQTDRESLTDHEQNLVHQLIGVLAMPDSINGKRRQFRIGYKYEDFVYLKEASLCKAIADALGEPKLASPAARKGDNRSPLTEDIMRSLDKLGLLMLEHDGRTYSYKTAIFTVDWYDARAFRPDPPKSVSDLLLETDPATVILRIKGPLSHLAKLADCRLVPKIVRPLMGTHKAINKQKGSAIERAPTAPVEKTDEIVDKEPETRVDSDGKVPPITKEPELAPPVFFEPPGESAGERAPPPRSDQAQDTAPDFGASPTGAPKKSTSSGLKRRPPSTSFAGDMDGDALSNILKLQAAAEARAAAKKRTRGTAGADTPEERPASPDHGVGDNEAASVGPAPDFEAPSSLMTDHALQAPPSDSVPESSSSEDAGAVRETGAPSSSSDAVDTIRHVVQSLGLATKEQINAQGVAYELCPITDELSDRLADILREIAVRPRKDIRVIADRKTGAKYLAYEKAC